ncbi:MAG: glycosyltransferase [Mariprofundaceae bacterium]
MKIKVLIIGYVWPEPCSSGAGVRMMELIHLFLEQQWEVIFASPAQLSKHMADLDALDIKKEEISVNNSSFDDFIAKISPNIVLFDSFMMEEQFGWRVEKQSPSALRIIECIDLHLLRDARHQAVKQNRKMELTDLHSEIAKREIAAIYRSDLSIIISGYEQKLLEDNFSVPHALTHLCPFMFDESHIVSSAPEYNERQHFITIGNFRHAPNWDSVLWLKQTIWPLIRKSLPEAELYIYGSYPPRKATDLHRPEDGFHILGWAPDVTEVMKYAKICLAPLRFGAGIKGKLADAMLAGTPNVTTTIGAEGMTGGLPWCGTIKDHPKAFAEAAIQLYQDQKAWQQAQKNGFDIINHLFNKKRNSDLLIGRIHEILETLESHRLHNFTGSMLRHHNHRSTEFMSRWIEEKNRAS